MTENTPEDYEGKHEGEPEEPVIGDAPPKSHTLFSNKAYDFLKFVAQIALPALGTFYATAGATWEFPKTEEVVGTIIAFDLFLGALLGFSNAKYQSSGAAYDGKLVLQDRGPDQPILADLDPNPDFTDNLDKKDSVTFKIHRQTE